MGSQILPSEGVVALSWTFATVAFILTIGRFIIHWKKGKRYVWDDVFNGLALVCLLAFCSTYQVYGPDKYDVQLYESGHLMKQSTYDFNKLKKFNDATLMIFWCVIHSVKASFLALYWMLFELSRKFRIAWSVVAVYTVISFLVTILWGPALACTSKVPADVQDRYLIHMQIGWAALDIFGDILLMALPLMMLRPLRMRMSEKIGLGLIFGLVFINLVLELLRTILTLAIDFEEFRGYGVVCFILQATLAVITCTLPCYRGLVFRKKKVWNWTLPTIAVDANVEKPAVSDEISTDLSESKSMDDSMTDSV